MNAYWWSDGNRWHALVGRRPRFPAETLCGLVAGGGPTQPDASLVDPSATGEMCDECGPVLAVAEAKHAEVKAAKDKAHGPR